MRFSLVRIPSVYHRCVGQSVPPKLAKSDSRYRQTATITTTRMILAIVASIGICEIAHRTSPTMHNAMTTDSSKGGTLDRRRLAGARSSRH